MRLDHLQTPALVLDREVMERNIARMAGRARDLGVPLRPHGKTPKNGQIGRLLCDAGAAGLTVSTLREAEGYFEAGCNDIFYAVALAPDKVDRVGRLIARGAKLTCLIDHGDAVAQVAERARRCGTVVPLVVEIDVDGYRAGLRNKNGALRAIARQIVETDGVSFAGIMSYGGASYGCSPTEAAALAETHRQALLGSVAELHSDGIECAMVSFGSSPAMLHARSMEGVTELRCGIYIFQDLFQAAIGACGIEDIAISVLTTVIGHRPDLNRIIVDAGGLAMSKDLSTSRTTQDAGYGLVCDSEGRLLADLFMINTSQELGILTTKSSAPLPFAELPIGTRLRILPNHADMTAAAYEGYHVLEPGTARLVYWERFNGW